MHSPFFTEEHEVFRSTVRQFIEKEVVPNADQWEKAHRIPKDIWQKMGQNELLGINYAEEYGGTAADFFYSVVFLEELSRSTIGGFTAAVGVHQYMAMAYIDKFGSQELKQACLKPGIRGEKIGALAITEPNTGSDVAAIRTRAVREDQHYIINGAKTFITNGVYGDFVVVAARTDSKAGAGGISLFVVDTDAEGFVSRKLRKIGWHCSDTAEISLDEVKVPLSHRLGEENMGFYYIMDCFQLERLVAAITSVGGAEYCLEITLRYITKREAFSRPISKFQVIRHELSNVATELEAARQLTYHACWLYEKGEPAVKQCSMAKLYTSELAKKIADNCLQFFGGYGYMDEYVISRMYRDARVGTIVGGTSEIMREIISKILMDDVAYPSSGDSLNSLSGKEKTYRVVHEDENNIREVKDKADPRESRQSLPQSIEEIFRTMPQRFLSEKAGNYETVFHFQISGPEGGDYTVTIQSGKCAVEPGLIGEPRCVVSTNAKTYVNIELGKTNPQAAFMMGKVKISNVPEMLKFTKFFKKLPDFLQNPSVTDSEQKEQSSNYRVKTEDVGETKNEEGGRNWFSRFKVGESKQSKHYWPQEQESEHQNNGALSGIRVLDLTRLYPGPFATMLMAELGADVIKIEDIISQDHMRSYPPFIGSESAGYLAVNRSKRSIAFKLNETQGQEIFFRLIKSADLVVEQFRPGVLENIGLDYVEAIKTNPQIIYVSLTGYGQKGTYAPKAGHDINYMGYAGLLAATATEKNGPVLPGAQIADIAGGAYMTIIASLSALWARQRTGVGQRVDVSMLDGVLPLMNLQLSHFWATGEELPPWQWPLSGGLASYGVYTCADGKYVALGAIEPKFWKHFCDLIDRPEWEDLIYSQGDDALNLKAELIELFKTRSRDEWIETIGNHDICLTPVLEISEIEQDPHLREREMIIDQEYPEIGRIRGIGMPLKFSHTLNQAPAPAPMLGQHTMEVLTGLGYKEKEIQKLIKKGIVLKNGS